MSIAKRILSFCTMAGILLLQPAGGAEAGQRYKPFVLGSLADRDFDATVQQTRAALTGAGFEVLGQYSPYSDTFVDNSTVIIVTNDELKDVARKTQYGGFAAPWRVAVTRVGKQVQVAYANPEYFAYAYRLDGDLDGVASALKDALGAQDTFGAKKGLSKGDLRKYHYTIGMEYFDNVYQLAEYDSHQEALDTLERNLAAGVAGVTKVYRLDLDEQVSVFGVARKAPGEVDVDMDEQHIMSVVDFKDMKGTAYLPYEIMVEGDKIIALHMRFRMAVHYPDLKMMGSNSFMNIMPSPNAIQKALTEVAGGSTR
jgi:uncharacterized protein (DUF302 family)